MEKSRRRKDDLQRMKSKLRANIFYSRFQKGGHLMSCPCQSRQDPSPMNSLNGEIDVPSSSVQSELHGSRAECIMTHTPGDATRMQGVWQTGRKVYYLAFDSDDI